MTTTTQKPFIAKDTGKPLVVMGHPVAEDGSLIRTPIDLSTSGRNPATAKDIGLLRDYGFSGLRRIGFHGVVDRLEGSKITEGQVNAFEFRDHGVELPDYFQGAGVAFTDWTDCCTGFGHSGREAADDAIENACVTHGNLAGIGAMEIAKDAFSGTVDAFGEQYHYVTLFLKLELKQD